MYSKSIPQFYLFRLLVLAGGFAAMLAGCNDSNSLYGSLTDPLQNVNQSVDSGPFPGCVDAAALDTSRIQVDFAFPPGATKMNIYSNGIMVGSSSSAAMTSLVAEKLSEGHTYMFTCEALINGQYKMGTNAIMKSTMSVHAPLFDGIASAKASGPDSVTITWLPADTTNGVAPAYYDVYYNIAFSVNGVLQNSVNWTVAPKIKVTPATMFHWTISGLGDELPYFFGVRACSDSDICDVKTAQLSVTLADTGAPKTLGATAVSMINGQASITAPWDDSKGAIAKRRVYQSTTGGTDFSNYILAQTFGVADINNPPTTLLIPGLLQNTSYYFIVRDEDPSQNVSTNTNVVSVATGDMSPPLFNGVESFIGIAPVESTLQAGWTAIDTQDSSHPDGASQYLVYLTSAPYPYDPINGLLNPAIVPDPCASTAAPQVVSASGYLAGDPITFPITGLTPRTSYWICVKAQDQAGNISKTTTYLRAITQDTTAPTFDGLQTIAYNRQLQRVDLTWNMSPATDLKKYSVILWKLDVNGNKIAQTSLDVPASSVNNLDSYNFNSSAYPYDDGDVIYAQVIACDNADLIPQAAENCSIPILAKSVTIPHTHPPKGFTGISSVTSNAEGVLNVNWYTPSAIGIDSTTGIWQNYAGFRIYSVDNSSLAYMKDCPCPTGGCSNANSYTSCDVATGFPFRTYTVYVAAYDNWGNYTSALPELAPAAATEASARTLDTTPPSFGGSVFQDTLSDPTGVKLTWSPAVDNQYAQEPGAVVTYRVYRKKSSAFTTTAPWTSIIPFVPKIDGDATLVTATSLTGTTFTDPYQINDVDNLAQGSSYYWVICAFDGSGNSTCNPNVQFYSIKDRTPPVVGSFTRSVPSPTWQLNWNMTDNISMPQNLKAIIRLRKSAIGPNDKPNAAPGALAPGDITVVSYFGSDAGTAADFTAINPTQASNIFTISNQQGTPDQNLYFNYALTIVDEAANYSVPAYVSVYSKLAPPLPAQNLAWQGSLLVNKAPFTAGWTQSADPDYASQQIVRWSTSNVNAAPCTGTASAPTSTGISCAGSNCAYTVSSVPGDGYYSFQIITTDTYGNTSTACSNKLQVDSIPPAIQDVMVLGPNNKIYTTGNSFFVQVTFTKSILVTGSPELQLYTTPIVPLPMPFTGGWSLYYPSGGGSTSASAAILFQYTVQNGDGTPTSVPNHLQYIANSLALNGGTILDQAGNVANLASLPDPATTTMYTTQNIVIDTSTPSITITSPTNDLMPDYINLNSHISSYTLAGACSADGLAISVGIDGVPAVAATCGKSTDLNGIQTSTTSQTWSATLNPSSLPGGPHSITATITNAIGHTGNDTITVNVGAPTTITVISGNSPSGVIAGSQLANPFVVRVTDNWGIGVPGVIVNWQVTSGGGSFPLSSSTTGANGNTTSSLLRTGTTVGANTATATISTTVISTPFTVTTIAGAAAQLALISQPANNSTVGAGAPIPFTAEIQDMNQNRVSATASISVGFGTNPNSAGHLSGNSATTANGDATFSNLSIDKANPTGTYYTLVATATLQGGQILTSMPSNPFSITAGTASVLAFTAQPAANITAGTNNVAATVEIRDGFGNAVTASINPISLTVFKPDSTTLSTLGPVTPTNADSSFTTSVTKAGNGYTLQATATLPGAQSNPVTVSSTAFNVVAAAASQLVFTQQPGLGSEPSGFRAGANIPVTVEVQDPYNNPVKNAANPVNIMILNNPSGGTLANTQGAISPNSSGDAVFTGLSINKVGIGYTLQASATLSGGTKTANTNAFDIAAGDPAKLYFTVQPPQLPATAAAGSSFSVTVETRDASDNPIINATDQITLAVINGSGSTLTTLGPTSPSNGDAVFTPTIFKSGSGYTLSASVTFSSTSQSVTQASSSFTVVAGPPTQLAFVAQPAIGANITAGNPLVTNGILVEVQDANNNPVTTGGTSIFLMISAPNAPGGTLSGVITRSSAAGSGDATFSNISLNKPGSYTLQATASGLTAATSNSFNILTGPATRLSFKVAPASSYIAGNNISVTAEAQDGGGNAVSETGTITLNLVNSSNVVVATLGSASTVSGDASFTISGASCGPITTIGNGYKLRISASGFQNSLSTLDSSSFNITAGAPTQLVLTPPTGLTMVSSGLCATGSAFTLGLKDRCNNAATWQSSTINIPLSTSSVAPGVGSAIFYSDTNCTSALTKPSSNYVAQFTNGSASATFYMKFTSSGMPTMTPEQFQIAADGTGLPGLTRATVPSATTYYQAWRRAVFYATGADQTFTVPSDSTGLTVKAWGAGGGGGAGNYTGYWSYGGGGAFVSASFVASGTLTVVVPTQSTVGGVDGGGGGYAAVKKADGTLLIVAAGGGGPAQQCGASGGIECGGGGGAVSSNGTSSGQAGRTCGSTTGGGGGTQIGGGASPYGAGSYLQGGHCTWVTPYAGATTSCNTGYSGGGGGYYGGGVGCAGGGGSSYFTGTWLASVGANGHLAGGTSDSDYIQFGQSAGVAVGGSAVPPSYTTLTQGGAGLVVIYY